MTRWDRFWFAPGGRLSVAAVRIAIALSVLWTLWDLGVTDYAAELARRSASPYVPKGVLMLLGRTPPPAALLDVLRCVAWLSTAAMLLGVFSRASAAISLVSSLVLVSLRFSFAPTWSHQYNIIFLAHIAFLFARGGDALSVDALIRRRRGRPPADAPGGYAWSLRLVQLAIALVFASAAYKKIAAGDYSLAWALSDNLRHQILMQFDWTGLPRTAVADWLLESSLRYRTAALLNLICQLVPIAAVFLWRRPLLRAACGALFAAEVVSLGVVMNLWNLHWLPLTAAFIDWDRAWARIARRAPADAPAGSPPRRRWITAFLAAFVVCDATIALWPEPIDARIRAYPFSSFPMFSAVRARPPYDVHQTYELLGGRLEIEGTPPVSDEMELALSRRYNYRFLYKVFEPEVMRKRLAPAIVDLARRCRCKVHRVRLDLYVFQVPAYPAPAGLTPYPIGTLAEVDADGTFRSLMGTVTPTGGGIAFLPRPAGLGPAPEIRWTVHPDDDPTPRPLDAAPRAERPDGELHAPDVAGQTQIVVGNVRRDDGSAQPFVVGRNPRSM